MSEEQNCGGDCESRRELTSWAARDSAVAASAVAAAAPLNRAGGGASDAMGTKTRRLASVSTTLSLSCTPYEQPPLRARASGVNQHR